MSDDSKLYALFKTYSSGGIPEKEKLCVELTHQSDYKNYYPMEGLRIDLPGINPNACVKSIDFDLSRKEVHYISYDVSIDVRSVILTPLSKKVISVFHNELSKDYVRKRIIMNSKFYFSGNNVIKWSLQNPYGKGLLVRSLDKLLEGSNVPNLITTYFHTLIKYEVLSFDPLKSIIEENELSGSTILLKGRGVNEGSYVDFVLNHKEKDYLEKKVFPELRKNHNIINMFGIAPKSAVKRHEESLRAWEDFYGEKIV